MSISPYIARLRQHIGSELLLVPSVAVLIKDADDRVLLVYETDADAWSVPGGSIDVDERPEDAARRETREEAGVDVELEGIVTVVGGPEFHTHYRNGDEVAYVATVYAARVVGGIPTADGDETSDVRWFARDELTSLELANFTMQLFRRLGWR
jgi:ADP-ribose pyrophosphatase YjhB (NUDIX family)